MQSEKTLIAAMLNGDDAAFRAFFNTYFPRLYRFVLPRLGGDPEAAKEVAQSTLCKAMRGLATFRGEAALFSWLCQISRREVVDYLRIHKRHADPSDRIDESLEMRTTLESIEAPATDEPLYRYNASQTRLLVRSVLDSLPSRYADVLEWKYIEERSVVEIGESLGIGHVAAQSILARARGAFREALGRVFGSTAREILASMKEPQAGMRCSSQPGVELR